MEVIINEDSNVTALKQYSFLDLPDYIIENYIFPFLTSHDLFFTVRSVTPEWHEMMKNAWSGNIKDEMFNQIKKFSFIYEKDALTKTYELKVQYLINYRNLLTIFTLNTDILAILKQITEFLNDPQTKQLCTIFFACLQLKDESEVMINSDSDNAAHMLGEILERPEKAEEYKNIIEDVIDIEKTYSDENQLKAMQSEFNALNKEYLDNFSENCRVVYYFLQCIFEYQLLKINVQELKGKVDNLFIAIQNETQLWPKKKKFFETAYKILYFSKSSNYRIKTMIDIFAQYKLKSPLMDYREESFQMISVLKNKIKQKKNEILLPRQQHNNITNNTSDHNNNGNEQQLQVQYDDNNTTTTINESIDDLFLSHLLDRRFLLTKKLILFEKFYVIYTSYKPKESFDCNNDMLIIQGVPFPIKHLLISFIIAAQSYGDNFNEDTLIQIKSIIEQKYSFDIPSLFYTEEELQKQHEIHLLKQEKEQLLLQKRQTEQVLGILKKYLLLKETLTNNKKKYKLILYLLSKIRKGEANAQDKSSITNALINLDVDHIDFECENISAQEKQELENFETSGMLLQEIENTLMKQIAAFFVEEDDSTECEHKHYTKNDKHPIAELLPRKTGNEFIMTESQHNQINYEMICKNEFEMYKGNTSEFTKNNTIESSTYCYIPSNFYLAEDLTVVKLEDVVIEPQTHVCKCNQGNDIDDNYKCKCNEYLCNNSNERGDDSDDEELENDDVDVDDIINYTNNKHNK